MHDYPCQKTPHCGHSKCRPVVKRLVNGFFYKYREGVETNTNWKQNVEVNSMKKIVVLLSMSLILNAFNPQIILHRTKTVQAAVNDPAKDIIRRGWFAADEYDRNAVATRADVVKIIMRMATNLPDPSKKVLDFADTTNHVDKVFILKARYYGVLEGGKLNRFYPDRPITRQELVILLERVFNLPDTIDFDNHIAKDIVKTGDGESYFAINKYLAHKIVAVDGAGNFRPNASITMGEIAVIAENMVGVGIRNLVPVKYEGQEQEQKILEPR